MHTTKCDKCGKIKKPAERGKWLGGHMFGEALCPGKDFCFLNFDLCEKCGKGLAVYLKKYLKIKN